MTANTLRILQIGDLHYGSNASFLDKKDTAFPPELTSMINVSPLEDSLRSIISTAQKLDCDAIVATGDLGDKGRKELYRQGVHFLLDALTGNPALKDKIIVLPGNHDIDRDDALIGIQQKFAHIEEALREVGLDSVKVDEPTIKHIYKANSGALLFALNSCIGCGERRFLPERIGGQIQALISDLIVPSNAPAPSGDQFPDMLTQYYEQLDTPAFDAGAIDLLFAKATSTTLQDASVFVIATHHNLLPQAQPRIAPYSELVNGGQFRSHLLQLDRPVIYLHGHIHSEVVEVIHQPSNARSLVISISAPLVSLGYNIIEILFTDEGAAFGCRILRYRLSDGGKVVELPGPLKIPFYRTIEQAMNPLNSQIMSYVFSHQGRVYWPDLLSHLREQDIDIREEAVSDAIRELSWNRYLVLRNEDRPFKHWRIEGTI